MFIMRIAQLLKFVNDVLVAVQIYMAVTPLAHNAPAQNDALVIVLMEVPKEHSIVPGWNVFANFKIQDLVRLFQSQGESEVEKCDKAEERLQKLEDVPVGAALRASRS